MATVTISEAARMMGWKSRSTIYRLRDSGQLRGYIRTTAAGVTVLEMTPPNHPPLDHWLREVVRLQANSPSGQQHRQEAAPVASEAERRLARAEAELAAVKAREARWISDYGEFRTWVSESWSLQLHRQFDDLEQIGPVMVYTRETLLEKLKPLDAAELASRFPR